MWASKGVLRCSYGMLAAWRGNVGMRRRSLIGGIGRTVMTSAAKVVEDGTKEIAMERPVGFVHKLDLRKELVVALEEAGITSFTEIQEKSIPAIREVKDVLIASHTGSGKTYAYLLPIIERLKLEEEAEEVMDPLRTKRPRAIVLGPTRELTDQVHNRVSFGSLICRSLDSSSNQVVESSCQVLLHGVEWQCQVITPSPVGAVRRESGSRMKTSKANLALHQDLIVATPSKLLEHHQAGNVFFRDVQVLVLDEADTMFDDRFLPEIKRIIEIMQKKQQHCQFILVAATVTKVLASDVKKSAQVMVFCNTLSSCRCIELALQEHGIATICYHGEVPKNERKEIIGQFSGHESEGHVLVCTDLAARGLDIPGRVDHIVNFDFPLTPVDYLHRSGRTARAGAPGRITSLVTGKDRVLADRIKWAVQHDLPLDELTSIKRILPPSQRPPKLPEAKKKEIAKKKSLKGFRGAKRLEALNKIAKENARQHRLLKAQQKQRNSKAKNQKVKKRRSTRHTTL